VYHPRNVVIAPLQPEFTRFYSVIFSLLESLPFEYRVPLLVLSSQRPLLLGDAGLLMARGSV
jgi:hypothetical protein